MFPYRDENETIRTPVVTLALIAINALVLPGISGSFILVALGLYVHVEAALSARDLARSTGVDLELVRTYWRTLGLPARCASRARTT